MKKIPSMVLIRCAVLCAALGLPAICGADGFIIIPEHPHPVPGHFSFAPLQVTYHRVSVEINDLVAVTTVDQEFYNPNPQRLEGTYIFPLPAGAQIDKLSMDINGKMMDAELLPADKARAYYEEIVRRMQDPALLEYVDRGAFRLRIYPIEPRSGKRIRLRYSQLLKPDAGLVTYTYPLNTEKFSSTPLKDVSVNVTLKSAEPLKSLYCPTHPAEIRRTGDRHAVVGWEDKDAWPDTDFTVMFSRSPSPLGIEMLCSRVQGEDGYFMLLASPGLVAEKDAIQPKDICFVLDTSGSMAGPKLEQAQKALLFCLANLGTADRFEIIRFATDTEPLFGGLAAADAAHVSRARDFVNGLKPIGGTTISGALDTALALRAEDRAARTRPYMVIFLTDGLPTVGETEEDKLVRLATGKGSEVRVFTFGIGNDVNTHLLDRIASETRAASQYVQPKEDIEVKVSSFYAKIRDPVLTNPTLSFSSAGIKVTQLLPSEMPDLFNGDMLVVFGRYKGSGPAAARISGTFNGKKREFTADVSFPELTSDDSFIPRMWATRRVGWLLDEMRMHGESAELRDEVTVLARRFGIVTPYTAYLVLEDEAQRNVPVNLRSFQELVDDREAMSETQRRMDSVRDEAKSEKMRSGASAVENTLSMKEMKAGTNVQQAAQAAGMEKRADAPAKGSGYRAAQTRNYSQQVRVVSGRAFYQNGNTWTDSTAQARKGLKQRQVRFGSDEYFALLKKHPDAARWFALGANIDIVLDDSLVNVRE